MIINKVKKIIVFGGGTSGWATAAYLVKNLKVPAEIVLIEDAKAGPIGVGEGTQPFTAQFLHQCGITPKMWMKDSHASFKLGVELTGWVDNPYFVDNDTSDNCMIAENFFTSDYFSRKPHAEFVNWHPAYQLAKANKALKLKDHFDLNFGMGEENYGAVHFSALDIIKTIKNLILDKITYVDTKIVDVQQDMYGISRLVDESGNSYSGDLYIDCTGFKSVLINQTLKVPFESYDKWLINDSAVAIQTQFKNPEEECHPFTKSTTMNAGWRWTIPIFNRIGNGYVYSSKFLTEEQAEKELRDAIGDYSSPVNRVKMRCGRQSEIAHKNVCAVGLSAGFVEPLEATGITFTTAVVKSLTDLLNMHGNVWNSNVKAALNRGFYEMAMEILTFVWVHYYFSNRNDTPYWQHIRSQKLDDLPEDCKFILSAFYPNPPRYLFFSPASMFNAVQWFSVLHAGGAYKDLPPLTPEQENYGKYFVDVQSYRVEQAKKLFQNQHTYLKNWYNE